MNAPRVLDGVRILDLSTGIAGPVSTMLLAEQGASITVLQRPGGDPLTPLLHGSRVWRRRAIITQVDLTTGAGRARLDELVADASSRATGRASPPASAWTSTASTR
jgi:crotonobetainyl-CoA:carnitine CoA-transferase CaiB-like acyl-CoA transferase